MSGHLSDNHHIQDADLGAMLYEIVKKWKIVLLFAILSSAVGYSSAFIFKPQAVAQIVLTALQSNDDALNSDGNLGSPIEISSVFGNRVPQGIARYYATMQSFEIVENLLNQGDFAQKVFFNQWDADSNQWRTSHLGSIISDISSGFGQFQKLSPDNPIRVRKFLNNIISFSSLDKNFAQSTYAIRLSFSDTNLAVDILNSLHHETIKQIRADEIKKVMTIISAIQEMHDQSSLVSHKQALIQLLIKNQHRLMLLKNQMFPVSVQIIDPPVLVEAPIRSGLLWAFSGAVGGILAASLLIILLWLRSMRPGS